MHFQNILVSKKRHIKTVKKAVNLPFSQNNTLRKRLSSNFWAKYD